MKKLNNKGFAISTVVYGLAIMGTLMLTIIMGLLSSTRRSNNDAAKAIEEDLIRFSKTSVVYGALETGQEFLVPEGEGGWYRIELWGAQGNEGHGGLGAYTTGVIHLAEGEAVYFYVGKQGTSGQGGKSTDVRIVNSTTSDGIFSRIMVAAGGGSGEGSDGGTLLGYQKSMIATGGAIEEDNSLKSGETLLGYKTSGEGRYISSNFSQNSAAPGVFESTKVGGEGYITSTNANIGGISFISGYAGSRATIKGTLSSTPKYTHYNYTYLTGVNGSYETTAVRDYYFIDGMMIPGIKTGDGKAIIERVLPDDDDAVTLPYPRKNTKLNGVKVIKDCLSSGASNATIQAIANGATVSGTPSSDAAGCKILTLSSATNLDEIAVWHQAGVDHKGNTISVSPNGTTWNVVKGAVSATINGINYSSDISETETPTGIRVSAYQPDYADKSTPIDSSGNYYIMPITANGKVISSYSNHAEALNTIFFDNLVGENRQKWSIEKLSPEFVTKNDQRPDLATVNTYKIVELTKFNGLKIQKDENLQNNEMIVSEFNSISPSYPSIWTVTKAGDGTVIITTVVPKVVITKETGNIFAQTNKADASDRYGKLIIGINNITTTRFKLYKLDL